MVGDAQDRKRWQDVHGWNERARRLRERALDPRTPNSLRRDLMAASDRARRQAHALTI